MQIVNIITQYYPSFFKALGITLQMTVISLLCATVLGVIFGLFKVSDFKVLKLIADVYIDIIRGTPLLVQVMIMMYGVGSVLKPYGFQWSNIGGAFTAGCVALSLNAGAYMAEIIRGGIEAVDKGQMEAARSLGLSYGKAMRKVILPPGIQDHAALHHQPVYHLPEGHIPCVCHRTQGADPERQDYCGQFSFHGYAHLDLRGPVLSGSLHDSVQDCQVCGEESVLWKIRFQSIT